MLEGWEYYEKVCCLLEDLEEIDVFFNIVCNKLKGYLWIVIGGLIVCDVLILLLVDFMIFWLDICIDLQVVDKFVDFISGNIDCVICGGLMEDLMLIVCKIGEVMLVICVILGYFQCYGIFVLLDELYYGYWFISYLLLVSGRVFLFCFMCYGVSIELKIEFYFGINESNVYIVVGEVGLGIVQIFIYLLKLVLVSGELVEIFSVWCLVFYFFYVVYVWYWYVLFWFCVFIDWLVVVFLVVVQGQCVLFDVEQVVVLCGVVW